MSKKSDDSIERIFRQALTQYDTQFHEGDWLKMEKMLEEEASRRAAARTRRIKGTAYTVTGLTGLIIAVYFLAIKNPSGTIGSLSDSVTEMQASEDIRRNGNVKPENLSDGLLSKPSPLDSTEPGQDATQKKSGETDVQDVAKILEEPNKLSRKLSEKKINANKRAPSEMNRQQTEGNASTEQIAKSSILQNKETANGQLNTSERTDSNKNIKDNSPGVNLTNESNPSLTTPAPEPNVVEETNGKTTTGHDAIALPVAPSTSGSSGGISDSSRDAATVGAATATALTIVSEETISPVEMDSSLVKKEATLSQSKDPSANTKGNAEGNQKLKPDSRWSIGVIFAPEFSTISLDQYSAPGASFGLRIAYQVSNKFSINTGLIRSIKKYEDSGDSYQPRNPAYWQIRTNGVVPEEIYSECLVYELPLGVQFDAIQTQKSRVFISTAISSYFMISQAYDYTFNSPNPGADMGWRSPRSENYWFSVGMVSAGYERYIHRSLAIGIEPYLKISLSEIGWPNIKLFSTGAYVTLRYRFMSKRNLE